MTTIIDCTCMSNIAKLFLPIVHTLKRTDYDHFLIQVMMVEVELGRNVQVGMLSKLGMNQVSTRHCHSRELVHKQLR